MYLICLISYYLIVVLLLLYILLSKCDSQILKIIRILVYRLPAYNGDFCQAFNGKKWEKFNSEKVASLAYARIQGKTALVTHFQNSSLMNEDKRCRPILFRSEGQEIGDQVKYILSILFIVVQHVQYLFLIFFFTSHIRCTKKCEF